MTWTAQNVQNVFWTPKQQTAIKLRQKVGAVPCASPVNRSLSGQPQGIAPTVNP